PAAMTARSPPDRLALIMASSLLLATGIWPDSWAGVSVVEVGMYSVLTSRPYLVNWPVSRVIHSGALVTLIAVKGMVSCGSPELGDAAALADAGLATALALAGAEAAGGLAAALAVATGELDAGAVLEAGPAVPPQAARPSE